jgi:DVNP family
MSEVEADNVVVPEGENVVSDVEGAMPPAMEGGRRGRHGHSRAVGSRVQVVNGTAHHTPGGLTKKDLKYNKYGRIVSAKKSALAKKKGTLKKWEKKTGVKWTIKKGKPVKVKSSRKGKKGGAYYGGGEDSSSDSE